MKKTSSNSLAAAAFLLLPAGLLAQTTGVSHPEDLNDSITTAPTAQPHYAKPSAAVPMASPEPAATAPQPATRPASMSSPEPSTTVQPVLVQRTPTTTTAIAITISTSVNQPATQTAAALPPPPSVGFTVTDDPNSGVVLDVPSAPNELSAGTLLHTSLSAEVSTVVNQRGGPFSAKLVQPVSRQGEVLLPAGAIVSGRIGEIHPGSRMHGGAIIQLIPEFVTLPDGAQHHLHAQVIDLPAAGDANVTDEGVIHGKGSAKATAAAVGLTTASATVAGALVGGGVGAAVGATVGAGIATVWYFKHEQEQTLREGTEIVFSLDQPLLLEPGTK